MITLEEKKAFYASRGVTADTMVIAVGDGNEQRSMTEEEFDNYIKMCSDPEDLLRTEEFYSDEKNYSWINNRIQEYPKTDPQFDAIFHAIKNIRAAGIDIGPEADAWVDGIVDIKEKYPKPV
jgi:hypothetical protein